MKRSIDKELKHWASSQSRLPLIIRGARQVGKSFSIEQLCKTQFESIAVANFEERPELAECFKTFDPKEIVGQLEVLLRQRILPAQTCLFPLLFLDEIQMRPRAITVTLKRRCLSYMRSQLAPYWNSF